MLKEVVCSFPASQEGSTFVDHTDKGSLLDAVANSGQVLSVIKDVGDHVLKLTFVDSSQNSPGLLSHKRYLVEAKQCIC